MNVESTQKGSGIGRLVLLAVHWLIIINFATGVAYAGYMVFAVVTPEAGGGGPLFGQAASMPIEQMVTRRLYALEFWVATSGFAIYLALTEIVPRLNKRRG